VIVVVASRYDKPARRLSERWAGHGGCLLTSEDLSIRGWRYRPSDPLGSTAILDGREVKQSEIRGVVTRLQWVWEGELVDIVSDDRAYVASEMSAFLLSWLSGLTCPVLNRPTASCLTGPAWGLQQWTTAAFKAGMRIQPVRRRASLAAPSEEPQESGPVTIIVAGERCLGEADKTLSIQARRLADVVNVDLLSVQFSGPEADACFVRATACPDIDTSGFDDAVLSHLGCI
jgi:hypothetical protein